MLNPSSKLKGEKDYIKYETAKRLDKVIDKIRANRRRSSIETLRAETPEEFYAPKQADDGSQLNGTPTDADVLGLGLGLGVGVAKAGGGRPPSISNSDHKQRQLKKLRFKREMHALALEGGDVARGYCSCDEQWTNSSSPTSTTTSATMSPTLPTAAGNASSGRLATGNGPSGNSSGGSSGIVKMAAAGAAGKRSGRLKQQHHVRFSDEKNFSD
ncbi:uncharacterized protein LOC121530245 [Drosophila eugracilis]|uniref:uncharacterized protein LOC121530245 n=1 Tax=Drosophila eugracilis TaxID=29029 RepID=UPI001BDA7D0F|nr:uncharacterized protein LOC121530245 [Drosophila eugracilis]